MQFLCFLVLLVVFVFLLDLPHLLDCDEVAVLVSILDGDPVQVSVGLFGRVVDD